jgi:IS30 family transposase
MVKQRRRYFSAAESAEVWDRWQRGEGLRLIGRVFGKTSSSIFAHLRPHGGIRPVPRRRASRVLSLAEREEVSRGVAVGASLRSIAAKLGRAASTVSRELRRDGGCRRYRAAAADKRAWDRALRPRPCKLATHGKLRRIIANRLEQNWSPQQIAGWLRRAYPDDEAYQVSHETIYRSLFVQARGVLKKDLQAHLRSGRAIRRARHASARGDQRGSIVDAISISERPASVEDRAVPGHWEGDLLCGSANSHIVTLVERHSRFVLLAKVANRDSRSVVDALIRQARRLPDELWKSLTWDRGKEMAQHKRFTLATDIDVYFCDPQSPWQRGSNENTNSLLRQYFPKGTDLSVHSQQRLNQVARQLNERPRKTLDYETPAERFQACVAATS